MSLFVYRAAQTTTRQSRYSNTINTKFMYLCVKFQLYYECDEWWVKRVFDDKTTNLNAEVEVFYRPMSALPIILLVFITFVTFDIRGWNFTYNY